MISYLRNGTGTQFPSALRLGKYTPALVLACVIPGHEPERLSELYEAF